VGQSLPSVEASRSHPEAPHSVGLLRTSNQPVAGIFSWQQTFTRNRYPCPRHDSNPHFPWLSGHWDRLTILPLPLTFSFFRLRTREILNIYNSINEPMNDIEKFNRQHFNTQTYAFYRSLSTILWTSSNTEERRRVSLQRDMSLTHCT
jgi:hypothetical protein